MVPLWTCHYTVIRGAEQGLTSAVPWALLPCKSPHCWLVCCHLPFSHEGLMRWHPGQTHICLSAIFLCTWIRGSGNLLGACPAFHHPLCWHQGPVAGWLHSEAYEPLLCPWWCGSQNFSSAYKEKYSGHLFWKCPVLKTIVFGIHSWHFCKPICPKSVGLLMMCCFCLFCFC